MHNFDLGMTADLFRSIEHYFAVNMNQASATAIIDLANAHQGFLPRRAGSEMFRLPPVGSIIAKSHANVNALQYKSALSVLPFMLNGATRSRGPLAEKLAHRLLKFIFLYLEVHHYVRRINKLPWYLYDAVDEELGSLISEMSETYRDSIGKTRRQHGTEQPSEEGDNFGTLKAHQLFVYLIQVLKAGGLVSNFDAQAGEFHHVHTKAHYSLTSKRADAEEVVAKRSTIREFGILTAMYPIEEQSEVSERSVREEICGLARMGTIHSESDEESTETPAINISHRKRGRLTRLTPDRLDGVSIESFNRMVATSYSEGYFSFTGTKKVRVVQTVKIEASFPWVPETEQRTEVLRWLKGTKQHVRASSSFYTEEPLFDFVEYRQNQRVHIGQVRMLFEHPCLTWMEGSAAIGALIRTSEINPAPSQPPSTSSHTNSTETFMETTKLFVDNGCQHLRWALDENGDYVHTIVGASDINRLVSITPDFRFPVYMEPGSRQWNEASRRDVENDQRRYKKEKEQLAKRIKLDREKGQSWQSYPPVRRARELSDGPMSVPSKKRSDFFTTHLCLGLLQLCGNCRLVRGVEIGDSYRQEWENIR